MADLKGLECLSLEEWAAVFQYCDGWKQRLVRKAAMKECYIVEKIASVMDKHVSSIEETRELKGILKIGVLNLTMCILHCVCRFLSICGCVLYALKYIR